MSPPAIKTRRRWLAHEVVQTSNMDCGPASLKCLLEGYGVSASYGRLREACQTDVDGTSIDALEEVALKLGLDAAQTMLPVDHLLLPEARALPALVVVRQPDGSPHFVVLWRRHGPFVQIMDPAIGRRWLTARRFLRQLYVHSMEVPAASWREWAGSETSAAALRHRMRRLGISGSTALDRALSDPGWKGLAALDAGLRAIDRLVAAGGLRRGGQVARTLEKFCAKSESIPENYWSIRPGGEDQITLRGAVLLSVRGVDTQEAQPESPELAAALAEKPVRPSLELLRLMGADGALAPLALGAAMVLAAGGVVAEAFLLRVFFDLAGELGLAGQRAAAVAALACLLLFLLLLELPLIAGLLRYGRHLEVRLRQAFLEKIPRLADRYLQSRLKSDMAERSHTIHQIRRLPEFGAEIARSVFELALTTAGIVWLDPGSAPLAVLAALVAAGLPLVVQPVIIERDLRVRTHTGAISRFYLDALLGLVAIRAHGAENRMRREHARRLREWARAGLGLQKAAVWVEALQLAAGYGCAAWLLLDHLARRAEPGAALLLAYWALNLPVIGQQIALAAWQYPAFRNVTLRLIEPLSALEERHAPGQEAGETPAQAPAGEIVFDRVTVVAAGHTILSEISATIPQGSHVAIVGPSGAGKSSFVGLLLGWHRPAQGRVLVGGAPLDGRIEALLRGTAWVDPAVQLWNKSLYENLRYGTGEVVAVGDAIEAADLRGVLERLPEGFETSLGEGGALVSGGEGQRVRLGRAMLRPGVSLAILDEPFRGLDCDQRRSLLVRARRLWRDATLLCITHDIAGTMGFERVLVIDHGRLVEDGNPARLAEQPGSRYRALLDDEAAARETLWSDGSWTRIHLEQGKVHAA